MSVALCGIFPTTQYVFVVQGGGHNAASITSEELEQKFTQDNKAEMEFKAGSQSYTLSFQGTTSFPHTVHAGCVLFTLKLCRRSRQNDMKHKNTTKTYYYSSLYPSPFIQLNILKRPTLPDWKHIKRCMMKSFLQIWSRQTSAMGRKSL